MISMIQKSSSTLAYKDVGGPGHFDHPGHDHALCLAYKEDDLVDNMKCHGCGRYIQNCNLCYYLQKMVATIT